MDIILLFAWALITLGVSAFSAYLGKLYGVSFPIGIMAVLVIVAAIFANKIVTVAGLNIPASVIVASTPFLITDILCEIWGKQVARRAVWVGLYGMLLFVLCLWTVISWKAPSFAQGRSDLFAEILAMTPRIIVGSIIAYIISQHHDVWAYHFWKDLCGGKHLWLRNNASTIVSQFIDTTVFITIAFYGILPIGQMIFDMWVIKTVIAVLDTPFLYLICWMIRSTEEKRMKQFASPTLDAVVVEPSQG